MLNCICFLLIVCYYTLKIITIYTPQMLTIYINIALNVINLGLKYTIFFLFAAVIFTYIKNINKNNEETDIIVVEVND